MYYLVLCTTTSKPIDCIISKDFQLALSYLFFRNQNQLPITPQKFKKLCNRMNIQFNNNAGYLINYFNKYDYVTNNLSNIIDSNHIINSFLISHRRKDELNYLEWHKTFCQNKENIYLICSIISDPNNFQNIKKFGIKYNFTQSYYGNRLYINIKSYQENNKLKSLNENIISDIPIISVYYPLFARIYPTLIASVINKFLEN